MNTNVASVSSCSCGHHDAHLVATRRTFDNKRVELWSDGKVNLGNGTFCMAGERKVGMDAGWLILGEVCLYTVAEWDALCKAAKASVADKTTRLGPTPLARLRARMADN
jgi:hypothetical protein